MTVSSQSLKSELECHKNNSLLAQRKKKTVKGKFRLVTKKSPACLPAKAVALKWRESALPFQSPLLSSRDLLGVSSKQPFSALFSFVKGRFPLVAIGTLLPYTQREDGRDPAPRGVSG